MGMYDELYIQLDLPVASDGLWQTKDLESEMDRYLITEDGRLFHNANNTWWDEKNLPRECRWVPVNVTGRMDIIGGKHLLGPAPSGFVRGQFSNWMLFFENGVVVRMFCLDSFEPDKINEDLYDFQEDFVEKHGTCELKIDKGV